jgi:hypothetical protein
MRTFNATAATGDCDDPTIDPEHYGCAARAGPSPSWPPSIRSRPAGGAVRAARPVQPLRPRARRRQQLRRVPHRLLDALDDPDDRRPRAGHLRGRAANPTPALGIDACLPVAQFWQGAVGRSVERQPRRQARAVLLRRHRGARLPPVVARRATAWPWRHRRPRRRPDPHQLLHRLGRVAAARVQAAPHLHRPQRHRDLPPGRRARHRQGQPRPRSCSPASTSAARRSSRSSSPRCRGSPSPTSPRSRSPPPISSTSSRASRRAPRSTTPACAGFQFLETIRTRSRRWARPWPPRTSSAAPPPRPAPAATSSRAVQRRPARQRHGVAAQPRVHPHRREPPPVARAHQAFLPRRRAVLEAFINARCGPRSGARADASTSAGRQPLAGTTRVLLEPRHRGAVDSASTIARDAASPAQLARAIAIRNAARSVLPAIAIRNAARSVLTARTLRWETRDRTAACSAGCERRNRVRGQPSGVERDRRALRRRRPRDVGHLARGARSADRSSSRRGPWRR